MSRNDPIYAEARIERLVKLAIERNRLDLMDDDKAMEHIQAMAMLDGDAIVLVLSAAAEMADLMAKIWMLIVMGAEPKGARP